MAGRKPRILCVDDEPVNLKLLEALLIPKGFEVIKVENGRAAIEKISEQKVDLVLLDVMMPEISGFDVCRMIKEEERYRNIPVVMITALRSKEDRIKGIEAGADDFLSKPFDQGEILARINMLLKMKDLNDRLSSAYANINSLISYGEEIIKHFDPLNFNYISLVDSIVNQNIRHIEDAIEKPQIMLVGTKEQGNQWEWHRYESVDGQLQRSSLELDLHQNLSLCRNTSKIIFCNKNELEKSELQQLLENLNHVDIRISNIVGYQNADLCVLALNYGREVAMHDAAALNSLVMQSLFLKSLSSQVKETEDAFAYTIHALARAAEANDEDTGNHIIRVGEYGAVLAKQLGMSEKFAHIIRLQAQMHDVGKIHIPPDILKKPGKLTPEEFEAVKQHTIYGAKILGDHVRLALAKEITISHHERWDGSGYPYGIKGEQIPLSGRILNIADQYDALRNARVYKPSFDHQTTYNILTEGDERTMPYHFDPQILQAFKETAFQFEEIYERLKG